MNVLWGYYSSKYYFLGKKKKNQFEENRSSWFAISKLLLQVNKVPQLLLGMYKDLMTKIFEWRNYSCKNSLWFKTI